MSDLSIKDCLPCKGGVPALKKEECINMLEHLDQRWQLSKEAKRLKCEIKTKDFVSAFELASKITNMAQEQWHHPILTISFGKLDVEIWTHKIDALVESDFIFAAKVDKIFEEQRQNLF